jgi:hypothetical protein
MAVFRPRSREASGDESGDDPDAAFRRRAASVAAIRRMVGVVFSDTEKMFWRKHIESLGRGGGYEANF